MAVYDPTGVHISKAISGTKKTGGQIPIKGIPKNVAKKTAKKAAKKKK